MLLSVVIGTVGQPALVNCCIDELRRRATMPLEIVVVDNGSTERERQLLTHLADDLGKIDLLLRYPTPIGYAAAYNAGIAASKGELVLLMNNDAWPTQPGWDARLLSVLENVPHAMLVSPTVPRVRWLHQLANAPRPAAEATVLNVPRVAFVAVLLRRSTLDALGPLDEAFGPGAFEDDDYCERIMQAGGCILVDPAVWFFHVSGVTMMPLYDQILPINRQVFKDKWKGKQVYDGATDDDAQGPE